tara:strand:+ start:1725 stop:2237 length:513 start_codon:yes stop_codon:yes gene_type:complete
MSGDILKEIANAAKFQMIIFDGALKIEGRILSPAEVESAGLASALLASQVIKGKNQAEIDRMQKAAEAAQDGDTQNIEMLLSLANSINPRMLEEMSVKEDQLIIKCVKRCSKDGSNWEPLILVDAIEQQDAKRNRLWIGMLLAEDRKKILDRAMKGHKEASERLKSFLQR